MYMYIHTYVCVCVCVCRAAPDALPFFVVAQPVSKFVCGGADLMLPGVRAISHESLREGSLAAVKVRSEHSIFLVAYIVDIPSR